jgi:glutathione transport system substrate-binding protein
VPYGKTSLGYDDSLAKSVTFDLSKAKELFAKAGFPNGFQASTMAPTAYPELVSMAQVLKADLATIGVQLDIEPLDIAQWTPRLLAGNYQASFSFIGSTHTDPASITANSALRVVNNPIFPQGDLPQAYVDGINAGKATLDVAKRKAAYKQTQETLLSEGWAQFISWKYTLFPSQKYVKDLAISVDDEILLEKAWLDK